MRSGSIKILGLATLVAGGLGLSGCNNISKNKQLIKNSGISATDFDKLESRISGKLGEAEGWQKFADSTYWSARMKKDSINWVKKLKSAVNHAYESAAIGDGRISRLDENMEFVKNSGISAKAFDRLDDKIQNWLGGTYEEGWQKAADSVYWSKKIKAIRDSVKNATNLPKGLDTLDLAKKAIKHL